MTGPLRKAVDAYTAAGRARFHMPGHKGTGGLSDDITEVEGCDSLYEAAGPILRLEKEMACFYGAGASLLSAGGATLCIQGMLALCGAGAKVIAGRGLHRSALNAMVLLDQEPVWVYPAHAGWFRGAYPPEEIASALESNPDAAAVYLTSPDYFGGMSDLRTIGAICRAHGKPLLVDNAHGAHLKLLGEHPMDCGASMCADSLHKTLPAMTGGAALHLADGSRAEEARRLMALFGSTSPSYPIMLSCERALFWARDQDFSETAAWFARIGALAEARGLLLPKGRRDPAKLTLGFGHCMDDGSFGGYLRKAGIEPEYIGGGVCVLMGNSLNSQEDYIRLEKALAAFVPAKAKRQPPQPPPHLEKAMPLRTAAFSTNVEIPVQYAVGRIAARESSPCPPGIPVVMCGERIDAPMAEYLLACGTRRVWVVDETNVNISPGD